MAREGFVSSLGLRFGVGLSLGASPHHTLRKKRRGPVTGLAAQHLCEELFLERVHLDDTHNLSEALDEAKTEGSLGTGLRCWRG